MKPPLVSILMATRDEKPEFLEDAVESICKQTYPHWEFLILDDGSRTERAYQWLIQRSKKDSRIKVFRGKGVGLAAALNELLPRAEGEYFARMDSDDWSYPQRIEKEMMYLLRYPDTALVGTWIRIVDDTGNTIHFSCKPDYIKPPWSRAAHSTWCGRTSALRKIGGYSVDFPVSQDYDCWLRLQKQGRLGIVEEVLLDYRWGRVSSQRYDEQIKFFWVANQLQAQRDRGLTPDIASAQRRLAKYTFWYGSRFKSQTFAQTGMRLWQGGKNKEARRFYLKSILAFPFEVSSWIFFFCVCVLKEYPTRLIQLFRFRLFLRKIIFANPLRTERAVSLVDEIRLSGQPHKLALLIPTANRPHLLHRLLSNLQEQRFPIEQVLIIDAGNNPLYDTAADFPGLPVEYIHTDVPSLTRQRNLGLNRLKDNITLVCFLDDDIVLEPGALMNMADFWNENSGEVGGAACNIINVGRGKTSILKQLFLTGSNAPGKVLRSGYGSMLSPAEKDIFADWIFGGATFWRREVFKQFIFDEWFEGYGFGEDLDFSYRVGKHYKLAVIPQARVQHLKEPETPENNFSFGKMQILNRYYFVRSNRELSFSLFFWASIGQFLENIIFSIIKKGQRRGFAQRVWGNILGLGRLFILWGKIGKAPV